jgi:GrpB-like predicted nucleotidyltransferase (UPF0157 family)
MGSIAASVEHVGSTSVPGLAAKPIIDIDIVVESVADVMVAIERLNPLGYVHQGNLGVDGREAFESPSGSCAHHVYVCARGSAALENHLTIRDYLRLHADAAAAYGMLKKRLAERFAADAIKYNEGKTEFLAGLLRLAEPGN